MSTITKSVRKISGDSNELTKVDVADRDGQGKTIHTTYQKIANMPTSLPANGGSADFAANAGTVNGHTVYSDVPAGAVFTDTWPSAYIASVSISGNTLTITPNTGSAKTFTNTTYSNATTSAAGLMSAADKLKLDGIAANATANTGTVVGSGLSANKLVLGNGGVNIKSSSYSVATSSTTWSDTDDTKVPTMKAISAKIQSSGGGGTTKYLHHVVFSWGKGSASNYQGGSLAFDFLDTTSTPYTGSDLNFGDLISFIQAHCNLTGANNVHERLHINAQMQYRTDSNKACMSANALINDWGSWYVEGFAISKGQNDFYITSEYAINWIPTSDDITLEDIVG
jgi:hypothetical protein